MRSYTENSTEKDQLDITLRFSQNFWSLEQKTCETCKSLEKYCYKEPLVLWDMSSCRFCFSGTVFILTYSRIPTTVFKHFGILNKTNKLCIVLLCIWQQIIYFSYVKNKVESKKSDFIVLYWHPFDLDEQDL